MKTKIQADNMRPHDVAIAGGGAAGLALAILLARAGARVVLIDMSAPKPLKETKPGGRTSALMQGSINILRATGAWERCESLGAPLRTVKIIDDTDKTNKKAEVVFDSADLEFESFGVNMPNSILRAALFEEARSLETLTLLIPASLKNYSIDEMGVTITSDKGGTLRTRLLVGADGRKSRVREIAGITCKIHDHGQSAITCLIEHTRPHEETSAEFHRPGGPFTLVPLPGNTSSVVWVERTKDADKFMTLNRPAFELVLQERTKNTLGKIHLVGHPEAWPLSSLKAERLTAPRVALMAEAAHVLHPQGAQGLNLSLRDVAALAETIMDALRLGLDPGETTVLERYERRRHLDIATRILGTDGLSRMVATDFSWLHGLRRLGLRAVDALPPLKMLAMREGLAPAHDESRLAKGLPL